MPKTKPTGGEFSDFRLDFEPMRKRRRYLDMTQTRLADAVGVHWTTIQRTERGRSKPTYELMVAISRALGTPIYDLVNVVDSPKS